MLRGTWEVGRTVSAGRHSLTHSLTKLSVVVTAVVAMYAAVDTQVP